MPWPPVVESDATQRSDHAREKGGLRGGVIANGLGLVVHFVAQVILVRSMGLGDFGLYALAISVIMMVSAFGGLGLLASLPRYLAIHHRDGHRWAIRQVLKRSLVALMIPAVLATGIGAILFLNSSPAAVDTGPEMPSASRAIGLGLLFAPFMFLYTWGVTSLSGLGRFRAFFWINRVLMEFLFAAATLGAWFSTQSALAVIAAFAIRYVIVGIPLAFFIMRDWNREARHEEDGATLLQMIGFGMPVNLTTVGLRLSRRVDIYVIAGVLGVEAVGLFRAATILAEGVRKLATPIQAVAIVRLTKDLKDDGSLGNARQYLRSQWLNILLGGIPLCCLATISPWVLVLLYGEAYRAVSNTLIVIAAGLLVMTGLGPIGSLFRVVGRNMIRMWIVLGMAIVNLGLNVLLVPVMGINGAAVSTFACMVVLCVIYSLMFRRFIEGYRLLSPPTMLSVVTSCLLVIFAFLPITPLLAASLMGAATLAAIVCILIGLHSVSKVRWSASSETG